MSFAAHTEEQERVVPTTQSVDTVDFLTELLEVVGWGQVDDEETEKDLS